MGWSGRPDSGPWGLKKRCPMDRKIRIALYRAHSGSCLDGVLGAGGAWRGLVSGHEGRSCPTPPPTLPTVPTALAQTLSPGCCRALVFPKISIHPQRRQLGRFRRSKRQVGARGEANPLPLPGSALKAPDWGWGCGQWSWGSSPELKMLRDRLEGLALGGLALAAGQITQVILVGVQVPLQAVGQCLVTGTQLLLTPAPLGGCKGVEEGT